jgi:hypoxanthine phosphoribosyltransferase
VNGTASRGARRSAGASRRWGLDTIPARMPDIASVLYGRDEIHRRILELGREIADDYEGREPVLLSVLKGSTWFLADLIRAIPLPLAVDFMSISRDVIVVEDIVDTGLTLSYLLAALRARDPASLEVCALLDKSVRRIAPLDVRYVGFDCPDRFVVGFGLDFRERYRSLPDIVAVDDLAALDADIDAVARLRLGAPAGANDRRG